MIVTTDKECHITTDLDSAIKSLGQTSIRATKITNLAEELETFNNDSSTLSSVLYKNMGKATDVTPIERIEREYILSRFAPLSELIE